MCSNIIVLYIFLILKIISMLILPILLIIFRRKKYFNILLYIDLVILFFFAINNIFTSNSCVINSNIDGIKVTKSDNQSTRNLQIHPNTKENTSINVLPEKKYKTYNNNYLYYFNQNKDYMKDVYYECGNKRVYISSFGSSITSVSIVVSTLYDNNINPIMLFDYYKEDNKDICNSKITIDKVFDTIKKRYNDLTLTKINSDQIESSIKTGGFVIAEVKANEDSKLTCDSDHIVIYNIGLDGKLLIADPALLNHSYVCPYSSLAYGNVIDGKANENSWSINEINKETINYYLIKRD